VVKDGAMNIDLEDQITRDTLLTMGGGVVHPLIRKALGLDEEQEVDLR